MDEFDNDVPLYELGVLFVHGIGQSGRAETLLRFGEPLRASIESVATPDQPPAGLGSEAPAVRVAVSAATLEPDDAHSPAHAELHIAGATRASSLNAGTVASGGSGESRWLMAEAWWAKKFPTPTFGDIVSFSFEILPWTLLAHFDRRFRRIGFALYSALDGRRHLSRLPTLLWRWFVEGAKVTLMLALSPLLLAAISSLVLLGVLPITPVRDFAGAVQRTLAATVGDSFVFMRQPFTGAAICQSVTSDLEWLAARCKKVVVVAHSQGGAIAHRVLRGPVTAPCDLLVTFGSGLAKLAEMERTSVPHGREILWLATLGASIAAASIVFHAISLWPAMPVGASIALTLLPAFVVGLAGSVFVIVDLLAVPDRPPGPDAQPRDAVPPLHWMLVFIGTACVVVVGMFAYGGSVPNYWMGLLAFGEFAGGIALAYGSLRAWHVATGRSLHARNQWLLDREVYRERFQFHNRRLYWYDFYASDDPVPNGRLLDDFIPNDLYSSEFSNARSFLLDHTSYWQNQDEFVPRVARLLLKEAGIKARDEVHAHTVQRRRWRVRWLVVARWTLALLTLLLALDWWTGARPEIVGNLMQKLMSMVHDTTESGKVAAAPAWMPPLLFLGLVWAIAAATVRTAWGFWNSGDIRCSMADGRYDRIACRFRLFVAILWIWCAAALWSLLGLGGVAAMVVLTAIGVVLQWVPSPRAWLAFHSARDPPDHWRQLRLEGLRRATQVASDKEDARELAWLGRRLLGEDDPLAVQVLTQASNLGSANAAWSLGLYFDGIAKRLADSTVGVQARQRAIDAFGRGAKLGDPYSARFLAYSYEKINNREGAIAAYRLAFDLGDAAAAQSLGFLLWKENEAEAQKFYESGVSRGDALSARFLGTRLEEKARDLKASDPVTAAGFEARALDLYRKAFAMGEADAARYEGNLLRDRSDIAGARRAYAGGVRLRDASCALRLGELEEEEAEDDAAAGIAYKQAIRLDRGAGIDAQAKFRQGGIAQKNGQLRAAINYYRSALGVSDSKLGVARAAVALAELLAKQRANRSEILAVYERGMALDPLVVATSYVKFVAENYALDEAAALYYKGVEKFPADALLGLGRALQYRDRAAACDLFERALQKNSPEAAVELYKVHRLDGGSAAARSVFDVVLTKEPWFARSVAALLERDNQKVAADELRNRAKAAGDGPA
jgi:tetratricopeptide (TPR) repeat protein